MDNTKSYPDSDLTGKIIGAALTVHKKLGPGFVEKIYQRALAKELQKSKVLFQSEFRINVDYKGTNVGFQVIDFIIQNKVIVELKSTREINNGHVKQLISYLKATKKKVGLILNFGKSKLEIKRVVL